MSRRDTDGKFARKHSFGTISLAWLGSLIGAGAVYLVGKFLASDLAAFRSCNRNSSGLRVASCGKQSLNIGDLLIILVFAAVIILTIALGQRAWRMSQRGGRA